MPVFSLNKPIVTKTPYVLVENKFKPGSYLFQLVVTDEQGNNSKPSSIIVTVKEPLAILGTNFIRR